MKRGDKAKYFVCIMVVGVGLRVILRVRRASYQTDMQDCSFCCEPL